MPVITKAETVTVVRLGGELSQDEVTSLLRVLTDLVLSNKTKVVLNFRKVTHMSLNGIAKLVEKSLRFRALNGEIKIAGMAPYVTNLFNLVGASSQFDIVSSEEEAIARFES
jgi:anti-sigma B factor antagonist